MGYKGELSGDKEILEGNERILIYGTGYGKKIYRGLMFYGKEKLVEAFIDDELSKRNVKLYNIPVINVEEAKERFGGLVVCVGGETTGKVKDMKRLNGMDNIHQILFNISCQLYGTEYGGFYLPSNYSMENKIVYSFGIGEDLSFSEAVIEEGGGEVYAFDPTPKSIKYVSNHRLSSNPRFHFLPYGLSNRNGKERFYLPVRDDWVSASVVSHSNVNDKNSLEVEMKTIRTIMKELGHDHIDILKMDIEGSEFKVIDDLVNPELGVVKLDLCLMETHERFFSTKANEYIDRLYSSMRKNGFYDLYGTAKEPTFIKV